MGPHIVEMENDSGNLWGVLVGGSWLMIANIAKLVCLQNQMEDAYVYEYLEVSENMWEWLGM